MNYALIDVGSNSMKLIVADKEGKKIFEQKIPDLRLGEGVKETGLIKPESMKRNLEALKKLLAKASELNSEKIKIFSTAAMREAKNAKEFSRLALGQAGVEISVLSQEDEAMYLFKGVVHDFNFEESLSMINIGGGTSAFVVGTKEKVEKWWVLPLGALHLYDILTEPPKDEQYKKIKEIVKKELEKINCDVDGSIPYIHSSNVLEFYTSAGVAMEPCKLSPSHPKKLSIKKSEEFFNRIKNLPFEERVKFYPKDPAYMKGALPGMVVVLGIARKLGIKEEIPSDRNMNDGLLAELAEE
jgi:exopolyphosphatase / guanosine-5'-triphosphate,3'-diphosphate pyrophosphatase